MYGSEIYHSREHVIYERRVKTRSGGLYLRDGERINPYSQARSMVHVHCMVEYVTWRPPPDQRIWYKICPAPDIRRSNTNLHCIFKSPIKIYHIKTHTDVPYPCYHGNALSINNYTSTAQSYIYKYVPGNISGVSRVYACYMY